MDRDTAGSGWPRTCDVGYKIIGRERAGFAVAEEDAAREGDAFLVRASAERVLKETVMSQVAVVDEESLGAGISGDGAVAAIAACSAVADDMQNQCFGLEVQAKHKEEWL